MILSKLDYALKLAKHGFDVFPLKPGAKAPPLVVDWPSKATRDPERIEAWWTQWPDANIGIHTRGHLVVDVDVKKGGDAAYTALAQELSLPRTLTACTPSGGRHLWFKLPAGHPGVANGVDVLGPGLDVRSAGGYVVGPGSSLPAGRYCFHERSPRVIADAPDALLTRCGRAPTKSTAPRVEVSDAADETVERARLWLKTAERSVKGQGGDQAAYRVACRLRDFGLSYSQVCELMRGPEWDFGCGWRDGHLEAKPIRSAFKYAQNEPGSAPLATADAFDAVDPRGVVPDGVREQAREAIERARALGYAVEISPDGSGRLVREFPDSTGEAEIAALRGIGGRIETLRGPWAGFDELVAGGGQSTGYLVKGLLQRRSYGTLYGAPGKGKTYTALDLAFHVAIGREWMGRKVRQGLVVYLAFEGQGGIRNRLRALRAEYPDVCDVPFFAFTSALPNLREPADRRRFGEQLHALPEKPALVVIDTLAHALCGGDENSAQDVSAFNTGVQALVEATGACVLVLHHSGKDKARGARGSSALQAAVDTELEIDDCTITTTKQRDIEPAAPIGFQLVPVVVGIDEDGDAVRACVVKPDAARSQRKARQPLRGQLLQAWDVLCQMRRDNSPVTQREWQEACVREFLDEGKARRAVSEFKITLRQRGYIAVDEDGLITRRMASGGKE